MPRRIERSYKLYDLAASLVRNARPAAREHRVQALADDVPVGQWVVMTEWRTCMAAGGMRHLSEYRLRLATFAEPRLRGAGEVVERARADCCCEQKSAAMPWDAKVSDRLQVA
jgi:hypothetical protein